MNYLRLLLPFVQGVNFATVNFTAFIFLSYRLNRIL